MSWLQVLIPEAIFRDDMYFGDDPIYAGATGVQYDNISMFNKALTQ